MQPAVIVNDVSKRFRLYKDRNQSLKATVLRRGRASFEEFWALKDVSFEIPQGSTFGLIGENGSGKSTMLKCIANILTPDTGSITRNGRTAALLELGSGFHPELSGRENIYLNGSILGLSRKEIDSAFDSIVDFSGIEQFIDQPVKNYSSGMYVRLGFSIAIHIEPEILLVDEILAVGDAAFQRKCMEKFAQFRDEGRTVVLVSHAMGSMKDMCDHVAWLDHGTLVDTGRAANVVDEYVAETTLERAAEPVASLGGQQFEGSRARVTAVRLLGADGRERQKFGTGEPMTIRFDYTCSEELDHPVFGAAIDTLDGVRAWSHHTMDDGVDLGMLNGSGTYDIVFPALDLNPGVFTVDIAIVNKNRTREYFLARHALTFDVVPSDVREGDGIAVLGARFRPSSA